MRVLLTGAGGQVARMLVRTAPVHSSVIPYSHEKLDISDKNQVFHCVRSLEPELIINAAAYTHVDVAEQEPEVARKVNAEGAAHLARAARESGARLIHISTDYVFNGMTSIPYRPDAETNPVNVYGLTKRDGERYVLDLLAERATVLRIAWVYSDGGRNFVHTMLRAMRTKGSVRVVADQVGTPTSAQSAAEAIWAIAERPDISGIHHWTDAGVASWYDFAIAIAEEGATRDLVPLDVSVIPIRTEEYPTAARRPRYSVLDTSSLISLRVTSVHWRRRLRSVLEAIRNA